VKADLQSTHFNYGYDNQQLQKTGGVRPASAKADNAFMAAQKQANANKASHINLNQPSKL
jgi:hypothetical protein